MSASIEFTENEDGTVEMVLSVKDPLSKAGMCAYALAKRGLTKKEIERYGYPGYFTFQVKEEW